MLAGFMEKEKAVAVATAFLSKSNKSFEIFSLSITVLLKNAG